MFSSSVCSIPSFHFSIPSPWAPFINSSFVAASLVEPSAYSLSVCTHCVLSLVAVAAIIIIIVIIVINQVFF